MLYFLHFLSDGGDIFNLFRYITFRAGGAFFTSLAFGFLFSKPIINLLKKSAKIGALRASLLSVSLVYRYGNSRSHSGT